MTNRHSRILAAVSAALLIAAPAAQADRLGQGTGRAGGGGGGLQQRAQGGGQRPANVQRPANAQRPANIQRPASPQRPANVQRPAGGGRLPEANRPQRPAANRPQAPIQRPAGGGSVQRPQLPQQVKRPEMAAKLPAAAAAHRPNQPIDFGKVAAAKKPGAGADKMAGLADRRPANLPSPGARPGATGGLGQNRPGLTDQGRPQLGGGNLNTTRPARTGGNFNRNNLDKYPGLADNLNKRPGGVDKWQENRNNHWNKLHDKRADRLDQFSTNRNERWDNISSLQGNRQDFYTERREDWQRWANNRQDYRQDRAWEVMDNVRDYHSNLFVPDWYYRNPWYGGSYYGNDINPWVWWRPAVWTGLAAFLGGTVAKQLDRDYGTQVYHDEKTYYIEGQPVASAPEYRQQALDLAAVEAPEEPFIPAEKGDDTGWYPLGVWALTQEEKGDAVMFYQLAVSKEGEVAGAYSNALTGESSPVTGSVDFETQRVAWRTGNSDSTAIEANLAGLTKDFTPVFVHYGTGESQEWLLVRMDDPS